MTKDEIRMTQVYRINGRLVVANSIEGAINTWREWMSPSAPDIRNIERLGVENYSIEFDEALVYAEALCGMEHRDETEHIAYLSEKCEKQNVIIEKLEKEKEHLRDDLKRICEGRLVTVEQIKSVYAASGILSSLNEKTDSDNLMALWATLKEWHKELTDNDA